MLRVDGTVLGRSGCDRPTGLYLERDRTLTPVSYATTDAALALIREMVSEFPFESDVDFANYLGYLLTPAIRPMLGEVPVPVALFDAAAPGTGKDLLARTSSLIYTGSGVACRPAPEDNAEWRKVHHLDPGLGGDAGRLHQRVGHP